MAYTKKEVTRCRAEFPSLSRVVNGRPFAFLDGPAGTQVPESVIDAISNYYRTCNANTHGAFITSQETDAMMRSTRETVAAFLGASSAKEISFGANMTTLSFSLSRAFARELAAGDEVVISQLDHEANRGPWDALAEIGAVIKEIDLRPDGTLDADDMARKITKKTRLVALGMSSNALGTVNDFALARELSRKAGAWLLLDAVHYAPHFPIDVRAIDPDFLLCSAYKFYGPHVGLLYAREGLLDELDTDRLITAEQSAPERIETGTLNHAAIAGVNAAIEYIAKWGTGKSLRARIVSAMKAIHAYEHELAAYYWNEVRKIPRVKTWGANFKSKRRAPTVAITVEGMHPDEIGSALAKRGIAVWSGNFYARRPIELLGLLGRGGVVRTGISMYNTKEEIERLLEGLREIAIR